MRTTIFELVRAFSHAGLPEPIYEFGADRTPGQEKTRGNVRDCFPGKQFVSSDIAPAPGIDKVLDLHHLDLPDGSIGTAILLDAIEHVERPWLALQELHRVLKPGGVVLMTSVMYFPIHEYPDDYWRFTASGFRALLAPFEDSVLVSVGLKRLPHTVVGVGLKAPVAAPLKTQLAKSLEQWSKSSARSWKEIVLAALPPFLLSPIYDRYVSGVERAFRKPKPGPK
jgi:SAM-dependent methyltransferase